MTKADEEYARANERRDKHVKAVLASDSKRKVVVAGPGTGKTYLFRRVLEGKKNSLTLTFINALVDELSIDLYGISEVRTLHSFATKLFGQICKKTEFRIFPRLSEIIGGDFTVFTGKVVDFPRIFHSRDDENPHLKFYQQRKDYYENSYGHSDIVFATVKLLEKFAAKIPQYDQIVVDEFQDFNALEVSFIDLLASRSPVLLAGDDDQAIYDRKHASAEHIRERYRGAFGYEAFELPYCSRCTRVVVDAANDVIKAAVGCNLLKGRIEKRLEYFDSEEKDKESEQFSFITLVRLQERQTSYCVASRLKELAGQMGEAFKKATVLVIAPTRMKAKTIATLLKRSGFRTIDFADRDDQGINLIDGLRLLLMNGESNLGWRIVGEKLMDSDSFRDCLKQTFCDGSPPFKTFISPECRKTTKRLLGVLRKVRAGKASSEELALLEERGISHLKLGAKALAEELRAEGRRRVGTGLRKVPIKVTTIQGSKGLASDIVFMTCLDDRYLIGEGGLNDKKVCDFLVALTRAKQKLFLLSALGQMPTFVSWIDRRRLRIEKLGKQEAMD